MLERLILDTLAAAPHADHPALVDRWGRVRVRPILLQLIRYEGAALWLHARLYEIGVPAGTGLLEAVRIPAREDIALNLRVDAAAGAVLDRLAEWGIPAVPLKGVARRIAGYPLAGLRWSGDVDLLLREEDAVGAWERLAGAGYATGGPCQTPDDHHHLSPLTGPEGIPVELHLSTSRWVPPAEAWRRLAASGSTRIWQGREVTVSPPTELLWHALAHALEDGSSGYSLRRFLDATAVLAAAGGEIDRSLLEARAAAGELHDVESREPLPAGQMRHWLAVAERLAGTGEADLEWFARLLRWRRWVLSSGVPAKLRRSFMEEGWRQAVARASGVRARSPRGGDTAKARSARTLARASFASMDLGLRLVRFRT